MTELFLKIINMSISASWLVLAVLLIRFALKKAPKWVNVLLWGLVAVRLICPFSVESELSLLPKTDWIGQDESQVFEQEPAAPDTIIPDATVGEDITVTYVTIEPQIEVKEHVSNLFVLSCIWGAGAAGLLFYTAVSYWRLRRKVSEATILRDNIYQSENVPSPFVLGMIKPTIYLPYGMNEQDLGHVVAHEQAHIGRRDHWWKPLGFFLLTIHWFNPLMWLAYVLLCRDIELACDEKVIKELGDEQRADYTQALVVCSVSRRSIAACPLAFGEVGVKERVKSVMNYKKPAFWVIVASLVVCAVAAICFLTDPTTSVDERLAVFLDCEIASFHQTQHSKDHFCCLDWEVIGKETSGDLTTVYMWVLYEEYSNDAGLTLETGSHLLTVITAKKDGGSYSLVEYWIPKDGGYYSDSIKEKVPVYLWGKAFDSQRYIGKQSKKLEELAKAHFDSIASDTGDPAEKMTVSKWFDYLTEPEDMPQEEYLEIRIPQFPDVTFRYSYATMEAVVGGEITHLYRGMPIWNAYFCDLTGDGLPELCSTYSFGSGMIDNRVIIYDYANGASYELSERGVHDFTLWLNDEDGLLYVDKRNYFGGGLISSGPLVFKDGCIQILGETTANTIVNIVDPTKDENFAYDTALEKFYEDANNQYFFSGIYSQYVIVRYADGTSEDIVTALNSGRATLADLDRFGVRYRAEPKPTDLSSAIITAILDHYRSSDPDGLYHCASFVQLAQVELCFDSDPPMPNQVTVYGMALHEKFSFAEESIREVESRAVPVRLTFEKGSNGAFRLLDAWFPDERYESWDEYSDAIYAQFSRHSEDLANSVLFGILDNTYLVRLKQDCYKQAAVYSGKDINAIIEQLFTAIESSPLYSSNPGSYIDAHPEEYNELIYYGDYTLQYIFSKFLAGDQIGLRGHIMRALLDDLAPEAQLRLYAMTGQEYFDEWKAVALRVGEQHDMQWIKENQPAIRLLLQMLSE